MNNWTQDDVLKAVYEVWGRQRQEDLAAIKTLRKAGVTLDDIAMIKERISTYWSEEPHPTTPEAGSNWVTKAGIELLRERENNPRDHVHELATEVLAITAKWQDPQFIAAVRQGLESQDIGEVWRSTGWDTPEEQPNGAAG